MSGCCGRCYQGREPCPHPEICEHFDDAPLLELLPLWAWAVAIVALAVIVVGAWL